MSVLGLERSLTASANKYDHVIDLVDSTKPKDTSVPTPENGSRNSSTLRTDSKTLLDRQTTKGQGTLRKELVRRKYAKYQEVKDDNDSSLNELGSENSEQAVGDPRPSRESDRTGRLRDKIPFRTKKKSIKPKKSKDSFIDVLYENQRGSFLCGIPLYSANSLLNFDPSPWQTANFQDSGVNITNFQLPDPSWVWDWKTWYVDMSRDVDEEGWEYSFSFNKAYAWHGNHPWLFSFTRRRRWLRKRVKIHLHGSKERKGKLDQAHLLNEDYFTIHAAKRDRSRESSVDRTTTNRSSYLNGQNKDSDDEQDLGEINNIAALMIALKQAIVDREKLTAIRTFLLQGGDELFYLADSIPAIVETFVHQTSRRQLQTLLLQALDTATQTQKEDDRKKGKQKSTTETPDTDTNTDIHQRQTDNLLKAVHAAGVHVNDVNFWSDLRSKAISSETDPTNETHALDATEPAKGPDEGPHSHSEDDEMPVGDAIKGIPRDAHVSEEPRIRFAAMRDGTGDGDGSPELVDKGKGKA